MSVVTRTYTNGEIKVFWQPDLCTHCEKCYKNLPSVFNPNKRPWVNMNVATSEQIKTQVEQCPSGALTIIE